MRVACVDNMNHMMFSLTRFLRDRGIRADLLLSDDTPPHFHPSADSFDDEYRAWTHQVSWGSARSRLPVVRLGGRALWPISLHPNPQWRLLDKFDSYTPRYQFFRTHPEVYRWFRKAELEDIVVLEPGVSFIGTHGEGPAARS